MSPELLDPDRFGFRDGRPTKESDCYAFGMVVYEVLSGQAPFAQFKDFIVMRKVIDGERPERPRGMQGTWFTDELWEMVKLCWAHESNARPSLDTVFQCLKDASRALRPPTADGDTDIHDDEWDLSPRNSSTFCLLRLRFQAHS